VTARTASVGDNCLDRYLEPPGHERTGGNALNVAVGLRRAGHEAAYLGAVGDDPEGRIVLEALQAAGVDARGVDVRSGPTGVTTVRLDRVGERTFVDERYGVAAEYRLTAAAVEGLHDCRWVHGAHQAGFAALTALRPGGTRLSYDFGDALDGPAEAGFVSELDVAFCAAPGGAPDAGEALAAELRGRGAAIAVVTLGEAGSLACADSTTFRQEAVPIDVVDTLGAGDAFIAGFIAALLAGGSVPGALERGAADAAETCRHLGAWPQPDRLTEEARS
jgi:fructoselysine 6-kinase